MARSAKILPSVTSNDTTSALASTPCRCISACSRGRCWGSVGKIIAHGTPRELIASIGVEHVVEFSTGNAVLDLAGVSRLAGVRDVRQHAR